MSLGMLKKYFLKILYMFFKEILGGEVFTHNINSTTGRAIGTG